MNRIQATIAITLLGLALSGCAELDEKQLLPPTRGHPDLGLRLRITPADDLPEGVRGERSQILRVVVVRPGRPAAVAGIRQGDILLSIDGKSVSGVNDSVGIMQTRRSRESVILTILRDGRIKEMPVALTP